MDCVLWYAETRFGTAEWRLEMKWKKYRKDNGMPLFLSIILVFCILGTVMFSVVRKLSAEMSASAIQNLSESLDLMKGTLEAILRKEAEFQKMMAQEIATIEDPEEFIRSYQRNQTMVRVSLIEAGKTKGVSNIGKKFTEGELNFSAGGMVEGLQVSQSYLNYMGTWAYTMKCPVKKEGREIASLYIEYVYDSFEESLPDGFYDGWAMLYIMDAESERFVLKPKGMGERDAGHLNLEDFYRANDIQEEELKEEVSACVESGENILFYHDIRDKNALNYMWAVNQGTIYLIGYVPVEAIQQEERTVNQNIIIVIVVMLVAFLLCCILYYLNQRQQIRMRKEQEEEREIHNKRLAEALQVARMASDSKTMFLSNMSHDIRTPMNAVLGFTSLLARDAENPIRVREYTKKIMASGQHLLSLINDILDVSKIESGKVVLSAEEFTLSDLVCSVDAIIRPMARAKHQNFYVEVTDIRHEYLMGDEMRINQILINLLSNAVKYTPEGGNIWFRIIGQKQRSNQYAFIRIEVEDDGYGMTQEYLKTIFDAFTRAENSTTNKVQGTGLGMAITKNIVKLMGGTIDVSSEVGKGSLFVVELEFRLPEGQADRRFWVEHRIERILAADSDAECRSNIKRLLEDTGILTDTVATAEEALHLLQTGGSARNYQVVLLSERLLLANGAETVKEIRKLLPEETPMLFLAEYDAEGLEEALAMAHTGMIGKPFFVSALQEKVLEMQRERNVDGRAEKEKVNNLEGLHFLAAEDNEINAEILEEVLSIEGADCELVENGKLALERFASSGENEFDAILMDVQMPVMNGYEATKAIRALDRGDAKRIPIIAMTANAFAEDEKEALNAGMNAHVAKPIDVEALKRAIKECILGKE